MTIDRIIRISAACLFLLGGAAASAEPVAKTSALPADRVTGLLRGAGLGYAKPADLNGWPGPLHALEMKDALALTEAQVSELTALRAEMTARAVPLGRALVEAERALDRLFASGSPSAASVEQATAQIAAIEARLRAVHLVTHLRTAPLLTSHQTMLYRRARGASAPRDSGGHRHAH